MSMFRLLLTTFINPYPNYGLFAPQSKNNPDDLVLLQNLLSIFAMS